MRRGGEEGKRKEGQDTTLICKVWKIDIRGQINDLVEQQRGNTIVLCPDPTHKIERRGSGDVQSIPWASYFLERKFPRPITLQKTQSVVQHRKSLATSAR